MEQAINRDINLLNYTDEDKTTILKTFNITRESLVKDIQVLKEWLKRQPHLPEVTNDNQIERFYLLNKCSIERTKQKLDMYYTIRGLIPDFYVNSNPKLEHIQKIMDVVYFIPLPQLTENLYRVNIIKLNDRNINNFDAVAFFAYDLNILEIRSNEDYMLGDVLIFDFDGFTLGHFSKLTPMILQKITTIAEKVFPNSMKEIHYLNASSFIDLLITLSKSVLKPKIANRIKIHRNMDSLYECIPKKILPKDYGGEEKSLKELKQILKNKFAEYADRFNKLEKMNVDEKLRPEKLVNDEILGFYGNFKQLSLD